MSYGKARRWLEPMCRVQRNLGKIPGEAWHGPSTAVRRPSSPLAGNGDPPPHMPARVTPGGGPPAPKPYTVAAVPRVLLVEAGVFGKTPRSDVQGRHLALGPHQLFGCQEPSTGVFPGSLQPL